VCPGKKTLSLALAWQDPYGGTGSDEFSLPDPHTLLVDSTVAVGGRSCSFKTVYKKQS
jgi:hypothetical protein